MWLGSGQAKECGLKPAAGTGSRTAELCSERQSGSSEQGGLGRVQGSSRQGGEKLEVATAAIQHPRQPVMESPTALGKKICSKVIPLSLLELSLDSPMAQQAAGSLTAGTVCHLSGAPGLTWFLAGAHYIFVKLLNKAVKEGQEAYREGHRFPG